MTPVDNSLLDLAWRIRRSLPVYTPECFREALEVRVMPIVRSALRSGLGVPHLVDWVRRQAEHNPLAVHDPLGAARSIAQVLCERLIERMDPFSGRETVLGP